MSDTIFALSSGRPPAAIAVIRISGRGALDAATSLAGALPPPRHAAVRRLHSCDGEMLDQALVLVFPGPKTATGEDLVELHLHGGRAVVAAVERALEAQEGVRRAEPGEFTRRALGHGRIDLAQAEGLADLLEAETEWQRRVALDMADGGLSRTVDQWMERASLIAAQIEADLDFSDEDDVGVTARIDTVAMLAPIVAEMADVLDRPSVERLRDGVAVVLAGPRNAGKSSLFNALLEREAAIVTDIAGTTRDVLEAAVTRAGMAFRLIDTAGLTDHTDDPVEQIGIARAHQMVATADIILWLGAPEKAPENAIKVGARQDQREGDTSGVDLTTSIHDQRSIDHLWSIIAGRSELRLGEQRSALHRRQRDLIHKACVAFRAVDGRDLLLDAEHVRIANRALAAILGRDATEAMLDALFGRFCIGK